MEECFQKSCGLIQSEIETHGNEIWGEIKATVNKVLQLSAGAQDKQQRSLILLFWKISLGIIKLIIVGCILYENDQFIWEPVKL